MPDTRFKRELILGLTVALLCAAPAGAAEIPVLGAEGRLSERNDPGVAARDRTPAPRARTVRSGRGLRAAGSAHQRRRTPLGELKRLRAAGSVDEATYRTVRVAYLRVRKLSRTLSGRRATELRGILGIVNGMASRGTFTVSRLPVLTLTLQRNAEWWGGDGSLLASGARVSFTGSELVWQSVPGQGIQFHPLANFGKLNALWRERRGTARMTQLLDELLPLRAGRAGGDAWEYYYAFGGGAPPWVSSLSQGTGLQATARAATKALRSDVFGSLERGLAIFQTRAPEGVRVPFAGGNHYAQYSYAPSLRIANGFAQSLVGLYDYAQITGSGPAQQLFEAGARSARKDLPTFNTGAWSLYSRGSSANESDLHYHGVLIEFMTTLCDRTQDATFCGLLADWETDKTEPPTLSLVTRRLRAGSSGRIQVRLSKISSVRLQLRRGGRTVYDSSSTQGYGTRSWSVTPPRSTRAYDVLVTARDLAGNSAEPIEGTIEVLPPRRP